MFDCSMVLMMFLVASLNPALKLFAVNRVEGHSEDLKCIVEGDAQRRECPRVNMKAEEAGCITEEERKSLDKRRWGVLCNGAKYITFCLCERCGVTNGSVEQMIANNKRAGESGCISEGFRKSLDEKYQIAICSGNTLEGICFLR